MNKAQPQLPFESKEFETAWNEWIEYRKQSRFKKYVPAGLKKTFTALKRISENNEKTAIEIIEQSMAQGYQGLFPLKTNYGNSKSNGTHNRQSGVASVFADIAKLKAI